LRVDPLPTSEIHDFLSDVKSKSGKQVNPNIVGKKKIIDPSTGETEKITIQGKEEDRYLGLVGVYQYLRRKVTENPDQPILRRIPGFRVLEILIPHITDYWRAPVTPLERADKQFHQKQLWRMFRDCFELAAKDYENMYDIEMLLKEAFKESGLWIDKPSDASEKVKDGVLTYLNGEDMIITKFPLIREPKLKKSARLYQILRYLQEVTRGSAVASFLQELDERVDELAADEEKWAELVFNKRVTNLFLLREIWQVLNLITSERGQGQDLMQSLPENYTKMQEIMRKIQTRVLYDENWPRSFLLYKSGKDDVQTHKEAGSELLEKYEGLLETPEGMIGTGELGLDDLVGKLAINIEDEEYAKSIAEKIEDKITVYSNFSMPYWSSTFNFKALWKTHKAIKWIAGKNPDREFVAQLAEKIKKALDESPLSFDEILNWEDTIALSPRYAEFCEKTGITPASPQDLVDRIKKKLEEGGEDREALLNALKEFLDFLPALHRDFMLKTIRVSVTDDKVREYVDAAAHLHEIWKMVLGSIQTVAATEAPRAEAPPTPQEPPAPQTPGSIDEMLSLTAKGSGDSEVREVLPKAARRAYTTGVSSDSFDEVKYSPDGKICAVIVDPIDIDLRLIDTETGNVIARMPLKDDKNIRNMTFTPDGEFLIANRTWTEEKPGDSTFAETEDRSQLFFYRIKDDTGNYLTGEAMKKAFREPVLVSDVRDKAILDIAVTPDNRFLLFAREDGLISGCAIRDEEGTLKPYPEIKGGIERPDFDISGIDGEPEKIKLSPDGNLLAVSCLNETGRQLEIIRITDKDGRYLDPNAADNMERTYSGEFEGLIEDLCWSPDGRYLYVGAHVKEGDEYQDKLLTYYVRSAGKNLFVDHWTSKEISPSQELRLEDKITSIAVSAEGRYIAVGLFNYEKERQSGKSIERGKLQFHKIVCDGGEDITFHIEGKPAILTEHFDGKAHRLAFSSCGTSFAYSAKQDLILYKAGIPREAFAPTPEPEPEPLAQKALHSTPVWKITQRFVEWVKGREKPDPSRESVVRKFFKWLESKKEANESRFAYCGVNLIRAYPNVEGSERTIEQMLEWAANNPDRDAGNLGKMPPADFMNFITEQGEFQIVRYSPDGRICAAGGDDGVVRLYDAETGKLISQIPGTGPETSQVHSIAFTSDSHFIGVGYNGVFKTFELKNADGSYKNKEELADSFRTGHSVRANSTAQEKGFISITKDDKFVIEASVKNINFLELKDENGNYIVDRAAVNNRM
ncbi:MAG: WD40 repeat domain-containing protein, partial [Candidatus Omnitrophota bacterium]